ncbi:MAG: lipopolysaccharide biosynthesis protein [Bacteroidaceae bacterium]|nr:lipopolysaccharide biosynthesis protein [Bacteroidaceae bacterium]
MTEVNQQRIAKNTLLLYLRMLIVMMVALYTSRVIIDALGKEHFGIYDAVGAIVMMVSFVSSTMSSACQRYYSYEMTNGSSSGLKIVFSLSLTVFFILTAVIILLSETAGLWFLNHRMDVGGHIEAAHWVFQFSIFSFTMIMLRTPYLGMVVAKEKMKVFAYLSLFEAFASFAIALLLSHTHDDKDFRLILYAGLMAGIQLMTSAFYWIYCRIFYQECRFRFYIDREKFKEMFSYAGWNLIGSSADVFKSVGLNLLLNATFGTLVSAARGVANKVFSTITQLNVNFFTAVRPQIYKSYAANEMDDMRKLICQSTRFSFFLLLLLALPILLETDFILPIWLRGRNVPDHAYILTQLMVIDGLLNCFTSPLAASVQATGNLRNYQLVIGGTLLLILPLSYVGVTYLDYPPASVFIISIIVTIITQFERIWFVRKQIRLDVRYYLRTVRLPILLVAGISSALSIGLKTWIQELQFRADWIGPILVILASMLFTCITVYTIGVSRTERKHAVEMVFNFLGRKRND